MTSFAEAFVRLHVDQKALRSDTEAALRGTDVHGAGVKAGQSWAKGFGSRAVHVSNVITGAMAGGAVAVGAASVKMAIGFQEAMTTLSTGAGVAEKDLGVIGEGIKKISVLTGTTTGELIKGEFMIASAGFTGASGLKILKAAAEGAKTGNADLATVTDAVTTAMKDYHVGADGAAKVTSQLVAVVSHGKTHLTDLATSLSKILPTASSLGLGLDQVGGAMATMTGEGVTARLAATHLNVALLAMASPGATAAKTMKALGTSSRQVSDTLTKKGLVAALDLVQKAALKAGPQGSAAYVGAMKAMMGGSAGLAVALQLTGKHMTDLVANTKAVGGASADAKGRVEGFALVQKDAAFKLSQFSAEGKVAAINIGEKLLPALTATMGFVSGHTGLVLGMAGAFGGLAIAVSVGAKAWKAYLAIQKFATEQAIGTRIELGLLKIQTLAQAAASKIAAAGQWLLNLAMDANPIGIVVLAIVALIAIFVVLWVKCKWFRDFWKGLWHDIVGIAKAAWNFIQNAAGAVFGWLKQNWPLVLGILTGPVGLAAALIIKYWDKIKAAAVIVWNGIKTVVGTVIHDIRVAFAFFVDKILGFLGMILKGAATAFGWIPVIGGPLKRAAAKFDEFRRNVNRSLAGINGQNVNVGVHFATSFASPAGGHKPLATGGLVTGPGTGTSDTAGLYALSDKEYVHNAAAVAYYGVAFMDAVNRRRFPRMAAGGIPGVGVATSLPAAGVIQAAVMPPVLELAKIWAKHNLMGAFSTALGMAIAQTAQSYVGRVPYVWGGTSTSGWDCSGMVLNILSRFGFRPPRTAAEQQAWARPTLAPYVGGLAFFGGADGTPTAAGHVGIIVGPNRMANAYGTGFGTIDSSFASGGAFGGFGIPPGHRFDKGGWLSEAIAGVGLQTGAPYMFHGGEGVTTESGLADLRGLLIGVIEAVDRNAYVTADGVAMAIGGAAHTAAHRAEWSPRG